MIVIHAMNNSQTYLPRYLSGRITKALKSSPVLVITGARRTDKSTLVHHLGELGPRLYQSLDDLDTLELATTNPDALVNREGRFSFDEVQRSPTLLLAVKRAVALEIDHPRLLDGSVHHATRQYCSPYPQFHRIAFHLQHLYSRNVPKERKCSQISVITDLTRQQ